MKLKSIGIVTILLFSVMGIFFSCDDDDKKIVYNNLPVESRHFIENYFSGVDVASVERTESLIIKWSLQTVLYCDFTGMADGKK